MSCPSLLDSIQTILGQEILCPSSPRLLFPTQVLSIFLLNVMDLVQSFVFLSIVVQESVSPNYLNEDELLQAIQGYKLEKGKAFIGGIFPKYYLRKKLAYKEVYGAIKKGLRDDDPCSLYRILNTHAQELGPLIMERCKEKFFTVSFLLSHHIRHGPRAMTLARDILDSPIGVELGEGQGDNGLDLNICRVDTSTNIGFMEE